MLHTVHVYVCFPEELIYNVTCTNTSLPITQSIIFSGTCTCIWTLCVLRCLNRLYYWCTCGISPLLLQNIGQSLSAITRRFNPSVVETSHYYNSSAIQNQLPTPPSLQSSTPVNHPHQVTHTWVCSCIHEMYVYMQALMGRCITVPILTYISFIPHLHVHVHSHSLYQWKYTTTLRILLYATIEMLHYTQLLHYYSETLYYYRYTVRTPDYTVRGCFIVYSQYIHVQG